MLNAFQIAGLENLCLMLDVDLRDLISMLENLYNSIDCDEVNRILIPLNHSKGLGMFISYRQFAIYSNCYLYEGCIYDSADTERVFLCYTRQLWSEEK